MTTEDNGTKDNTNDNNNSDSKYNWEILPDDYTQYDLAFKVIVIGDSGVGKSCLSNKATKNVFDENYNATIGFEFFVFNIKFDDTIVKLQVWDTCGQELYRTLITNFYRNSSLAILVYEINSKQTFENVDMWLKELRSHANPDVKIFLIGNKVDLEDQREVDTKTGESYSKQNKMNLFMESSAKTGFNAQKIFVEAARILYEDYGKFKKTNMAPKLETVGTQKLKNLKKEKIKKNKGCC